MAAKQPPRRRIAPAIQAAVFTKSRRRCALCFHLDRDTKQKHGQIAHLDRRRTNSDEENLAFLCLPHHSEYDSTTSQHKNYTIDEVKTARKALYAWVKKGLSPLSSSASKPSENRRDVNLPSHPARRLPTDWTLFDRRYKVYLDTREFISYVLGNNGDIVLVGPGEYRDFRQTMDMAKSLFGMDVRDYLEDVDKTAREFWASARKRTKAINTGDVEAIERDGELLSRLSDVLLPQLEIVFRPYLSIGDPRAK